MSEQLRYTCWTCLERLPIRFGTDGHGHLVEERAPCRCERGLPPRPRAELVDDFTDLERERIARKTGICMDCERPVEGKRGWALRCAEHKRAARRAADRRHYEAHREEELRDNAEYRQRPEVRERRAARRRELHAQRMATDPEYAAAYKRRRQRETSIKHPSYARRIESFRRSNADPVRAAKKREWALRRYYELYPERPQPTCSTCGEAIPYDGRGAPPKYHQTQECNPHFARRRKPVTAGR